MKELDSLYIERNDCNNCCRCLRECDQKAVVFSGGGPAIDPQLCVSCGKCFRLCKSGAVRVRDDVHLARQIAKSDCPKVISLSPEWSTEFQGISENRLAEALTLLGFDHVAESSSARKIALAAEHSMSSVNGIHISSRCSAVREYIQKYRPRFVNTLLPVASDMVLHSRMIRKAWGEGISVVHVSSCAACKREAGTCPEVDLVLTYRELKRWMRNEGIRFDKISGADSYRFDEIVWEDEKYSKAPVLPTGRGKITESGFRNIGHILERAPSVCDHVSVFLDFTACRQGCLGSPLSTVDKVSLLELSIDRMKYGAASNRRLHHISGIKISPMEMEHTPVARFVPESETLSALEELGIGQASRQTDCNGCGFGTCRRFAKALSRGEVAKSHCISYLEQEGTVKFRALLSRLSSGIALVNNELKIEEANRVMASMLGPEAEYLFDKNEGFSAMAVSDVLPFHRLVAAILESGEESLVRDVEVKGRILTVSVHTLQKYKRALVICRSMVFSQVRNEEIVSRTRKVIEENLETVRKIAFLLGENASRTEAMLSSILNAQLKDDVR